MVRAGALGRVGGGLVGRRDEGAAGRGAVGAGVVGDRARVEVGLGHGVDGGAGRGLAGARVVARQTGGASVLSSLTATAWMVTLPVLVTV